jgi:hypothetical protein
MSGVSPPHAFMVRTGTTVPLALCMCMCVCACMHRLRCRTSSIYIHASYACTYTYIHTHPCNVKQYVMSQSKPVQRQTCLHEFGRLSFRNSARTPIILVEILQGCLCHSKQYLNIHRTGFHRFLANFIPPIHHTHCCISLMYTQCRKPYEWISTCFGV